MPEEPGFRFELGIALTEKGQLEQAISQLREGLHLEPENAKIRQILEELLIQQGRENKAVTK